MPKHLPAVLGLILFTLLGYYQFPGHTYLQSDTQIYIPILERLWDPSVLSNDLVATKPHVAFTIYDEAARALRKITGLGFHEVLAGQQLIFRAFGLLGVYLLATSLALSPAFALFVAGLYSLGATISGPAVLSVEYEPVPRGFAVALLLFAMGLAAHSRPALAALAAALAFLYHPPTAAPFWVVYCSSLFWTRDSHAKRGRLVGLGIFASAVTTLLFMSRLQSGHPEPQVFFELIDPAWEKLQRMRTSYNWVSIWSGQLIWHYLFLWLASLCAFLRIRQHVLLPARDFLLGLPLIGILSIPLSYLLLEKLRWALVPQFQPVRALLFVPVMAVILSGVAGIHCAARKKYLESSAWFLIACTVPVQIRILQILLPNLANPLIFRRVLVIVVLAVLASFAATLRSRTRSVALLGLIVAACWLIPSGGKVRNYSHIENSNLDELAEWAKSGTAKNSVFLFPKAGQSLEPGIFRAKSLRAVYVDWKSGGQVNYYRSLGQQWWERWNNTRVASPEIDYAVLPAKDRVEGATLAYQNSGYIVYVTQPGFYAVAKPR